MRYFHINLLLLITVGIGWSNNLNTGGQKGVMRTLTVETHGIGGIHVGLGGKYDYDESYIKGAFDSSKVINHSNSTSFSPKAAQLISTNLFLSYGLNNWWDVGADLPLYHDNSGWEDHTSFGNLELSTKIRYPFKQEELFINQAYYFKVILPTGNKGGGLFPRHAYYTSSEMKNKYNTYTANEVIFIPQMVWSAYFNRLNPKLPLALHFNFGGAIHSTGAILSSVALEYYSYPNLNLFLELSGESRVTHYLNSFSFSSFNNDIFLLTPGISYRHPKGYFAKLGIDLGFADDGERSNWKKRNHSYSTKGSPFLGVNLQLGWGGLGGKLDSDGDGIPNSSDVCPHEPEDVDGFQNEDGCPDQDNDNDGVLDRFDQCPLVPAPSNGCPTLDSDQDGIPDNIDKCPNEPEDYDGFTDTDGCPEQDNDADQIFDRIDKCPNLPEDNDGFEDSDGCPELDNDQDGSVDTDDDCPNSKGLPSNKGCPLSEIKGQLILIGVNFKTGSSELTPSSFNVLDHVILSILENPAVSVEIQGHTDNQGSDKKNQEISQKRAETVRAYMISKGVEAKRLEAKGYGASQPIADNTTEQGREKNRRVELKRLP